MAGTDKSNQKAVAERLQGLRWYRVHFALYGNLEVKAKSAREAEEACMKHDLGNHIEDVEVTHVEEE